MRVEVLYPEICNLYGELGNITYLERSIDNLEVIHTSIKDKPVFIDEHVDLVYMGTMTERAQLLVVDALKPYTDKIRARIDEGINFIITGNALEVFGGDILEEGEKVGTGLGILDFESRRKARIRYNCLYVGDFCAEDADETMKIVGFKSLFGFAYGKDIEAKPFLNTKLGYGSNKETACEGIRVNNFFATYLTGPLFVLNPLFFKWIMNNKMGASDAEPAYMEEAMQAYNYRLAEYTKPGKGWEY